MLPTRLQKNLCIVHSITVLAWIMMLSGPVHAENARGTDGLGQSSFPCADKTGKVVLTLSDCLDLARRHNPDLARQKWDVEAAESEHALARSKRKPEVRVQSSYGHSVDPQAIIKPRRVGDPIPFSKDIMSTDLVLSMPLSTGGRLESKAAGARLQAASQRQKLSFTEDELAFAVASAFIGILGQRKVVESLEMARTTLSEHQKRVVALLNVQKAAKVDLLRTEVRLAEVEQRLIKEENTLIVMHYQLGNLMGIMCEPSTLKVAGDLQVASLPLTLAAAHEMAQANRKDFKALKLQVDAQRQHVRAAKAERAPEISLRASYGNRWPGARSLGSQEAGELLLVAGFPVFDGGRINASVRRERSRQKALTESLRKLELQIRLEVQTAVANLESALAREAVTQKAVAQASESLRIERGKYELGKGTIIDVLDAQSALLDSETVYYRACADFNVALAAFHLATGVHP